MKKVLFLITLIMAALFTSVSAFAYGGNDGIDWGDWNLDGNANNGAKVGFYIQIGGEQMDTEGNISGRDKEFFTEQLATTTLTKSLSSDYTIAYGDNVTEEDITKNLSSVPNQKDILAQVVAKYQEMDAYIKSSNGKVIPWSKMTTNYYKVRWYVLKKESDCWHVDGVIIDLETDKEISIVVPEKDTKRAACVEYNVASGEFTPGFMKVKANRPHAIWEGDNDNVIIEGFHDVWYTVLDEDTFEKVEAVVPSKLIDAATAVETLAGARLSQLNEQLQREYGRIDSQAYKQEYIERTGAGRTLYVTPYITELLSQRYGVDSDKYIWLAMGDSHGNILKVYVMDRDMADVKNLFDNE